MQSAILGNAFEIVISILGERTKEALNEDLKKYGVFSNDPNLTFSKLIDGLRKVVGNEATELIAERLIIKLDELHSAQKQEK